MSKAGATRIGIFHKNVPNVIAALTSIMSGDNINIEAMVNNSKGSNAYTVIDTNDRVDSSVIDEICAVGDVYRAFVI